MGMGTYKIQEELTGFTIITGSLPDLLWIVFKRFQQIFQNQYDLKEGSIHFAGLYA
jgi:hypothetical protein